MDSSIDGINVRQKCFSSLKSSGTLLGTLPLNFKVISFIEKMFAFLFKLVHFVFSLPLIFTLVAASISNFLTAAI